MSRRLHYALVCLLAALCAFSASPAQAKEPGWGRVYVVSGKVPVLENPSDKAVQVRVLKSGQKVRVDFEDEGWAAVFDPAESKRSELRAQGYVRLAELRTGARAEAAPRAENAEASPKAKESKKAAPAQGFGEIRVSDRPLTVRAARDKDAAFVRLLQPGRRVRVDFQADGWYAVFDPEERVRDLSRAWGYSRDKYLIPEKDFTGQVLPDAPSAPVPAAKEPPVKEKGAKEQPAKEHSAKELSAKPLAKDVPAKAADDAVGYAVVDRHADPQRPLSPVVLRVRVEAPVPPAPDALRKIVREIWKAERKKGEDLQLEVLLPGMDKAGLSYAVARFYDDGRLKEFWWRDVVRPKK